MNVKCPQCGRLPTIKVKHEANGPVLKYRCKDCRINIDGDYAVSKEGATLCWNRAVEDWREKHEA